MPVIVTLAVPVVAVLLAVRVSVLLLVVELGLKDAVTPLGSPDADSPTLPAKPFSAETETVLVPLAPCTIVKLDGDADKLKSATAAGVKVATDW